MTKILNFTKEQENEIVSLYKDKLMNYKEIGNIYNCSESPILKILISNNSLIGCSERKKILFENDKIKSWNKNLTKENDHRVNRLANGLKGKPKSEEHKQKLKDSWNYEKHFTKEIRKNMGLAHLGKKQYEMTDIIREKISKSNLRKHHSPKTEFKIGDIRISGKNNKLFNNYSSFEPYGFEFNKKLKNSIRKRDNQVCMNCGIHREKLNEALTAHHINYDKQCNLQENLISLCRCCHGLTNFNREYWQKLFQEKLSKLYNYEYSEGQIILNLNEVKN